MLKLLPILGDMAPALKEPFVCLLWQLMHCPLAAFGALWGQVLIKGKTDFEQSKVSVEAIEHLPAFLSKLSSRHPLAAKLGSITEKIVQQLKTILCSQSRHHSQPEQ